MFEKLKNGLKKALKKPDEEPESKTSSGKEDLSIVEKISKKKLSEEDLDSVAWDLEVALLENDVAKEVSEEISEGVKKELLGETVQRKKAEEKVKKALKKSIKKTLTFEKPDIFSKINKREGPYLIIFFGFNGTGKTMTIGKFAKLLLDNGYSVALAAGDTFRAAAIEQLQEHADKLEEKTEKDVPLIKQERGSDSAAVIYDAVDHANAEGIDVVLADTAGRTSTDNNLMDELKKVVRVNDPDFKIFIGDALTGNDAAQQAKSFEEAVGVDGSVLTKVDAGAKGGACLSVAHITGKPILYLGTGQGYDDMKEFDSDWFVSKIFENS